MSSERFNKERVKTESANKRLNETIQALIGTTGKQRLSGSMTFGRISLSVVVAVLFLGLVLLSIKGPMFFPVLQLLIIFTTAIPLGVTFAKSF